jgi:hypothetical protein
MTYYKLSYGPSHFCVFETHEALQESFPKFRDHLIKTGVIRMVKTTMPGGYVQELMYWFA